MSYEVTLTPEAKHDLREIYRYIAVELQSEQNANGQLDRLEESSSWTRCRSGSGSTTGNHGTAATSGSCRWTITWCSTSQTTR